MLQLMVMPSTPPATSGRPVAGKNWKSAPLSLAEDYGKHFASTTKRKIIIGKCCLHYETLWYLFPTALHQSASSANRELALA